MWMASRKEWLSGAATLLLLLIAVVAQGCASGYETLEVDGGKRQFLLHVPENLPADTCVPLLMALHQFSDTPRGMQMMTGFSAMADRESFIVVYPQGLRRRWNSGIDDDDRDIRFLLVLMDKLIEQYPVDANRIYGTGASAGGMMIQALAYKTDRLAAIAPVMGSLTTDYEMFERTLPPLPVLLMHGVDDPVIPFEGGRAGGPHETKFLSAEANAALWAHAAGCTDEPEISIEVVDDGNNVSVRHFLYVCPNSTEVHLYAIKGCGHSWPGHQSRYPAFIVGPSVAEPKASEIIWNFFWRHSREEDGFTLY